MILNVTYDTALARVQLTADVIVDRKTARVERSLNETLWTAVRGGAAIPVVDGSIAVDDYEFASDLENFYRVTPLDYVAGFETNTAGWEPVGGTLARSTTQAHTDAASALLTPDGVSATVRARTTLGNRMPVVGGKTCELSVWVYRDAVGSRDVDISVEFQDSAGSPIEFVIWTTVTVPAAVWTRVAGTRVAPGNAVTASINVNQRDTPATSDKLHIDDVEFTPVEYTGEAQTASITPSLAGQIWLKSIKHPFLNRPITATEFADPERASRTGVFEVKGRSVPVAVADVRASPAFTVEVKTETLTEARDMDLILASGSQFFIHVPADCPVPGGYVEVGDTSQARRLRSAKSPRRYFTLPCRVAAAPGPDVVGATMTWGAVLAFYGSWEQLLASNPTWADLLVDVAGPDDLVSL